MNKKIFGICICLLILHSYSIVCGQNTLEDSEKNWKTISSIYDNDLPIWDTGDSWIYDIELNGSSGALTVFKGGIENLLLTIIDDSESLFQFSFKGSIFGELSTEEITGSFKDTIIEGNAFFNKENLGLKNLDVKIEGRLVVVLLPILIDLNLNLDIEPPYNPVDFPLFIDKHWMVPLSFVKGSADIPILGTIEISIPMGGGSAECIAMDNITVEAGTYHTYKIITNMDIKEYYYAPTVGNIVKAVGRSYDFEDIIIELKSTTYERTGAPKKPMKPAGQTSGKPGNEYVYSTNTIDFEDDPIYYLFDWGDGTDSGWIGPYDSGETVISSHIWSQEGRYSVRVKAKDIEDHESEWSDSLIVSISKKKGPVLFSLMCESYDYDLNILDILRFMIKFIFFVKNNLLLFF